jgi:hypothetical protein
MIKIFGNLLYLFSVSFTFFSLEFNSSILEQKVTPDYPNSITFEITLDTSSKQVRDAHLFVSPFAEKIFRGYVFTDAQILVIENETKIKKVFMAEHEREKWKIYYDLPFSPHEYYWTIYFTDGSRLETPLELIYFEDVREFAWKSAETDNFIFRWYSDKVNIDEIQKQSENNFSEFAQMYPIEQPPYPIQVIIFEKSEDLSVWKNYRPYFVAIALLRDNSVIYIWDEVQSYSSTQSSLRHEMTHVMIYYLVGDEAYGSIPEWLNEGLAVYNEKNNLNQDALERYLPPKVLSNRVISLSEMDNDKKWDIAEQPYLEAFSATSYLIERYGEEKVIDLLPKFHKYGSVSLTTQSELGISYDELNSDWFLWLEQQYFLTATETPQQTPVNKEKSTSPSPTCSSLFIFGISVLLISQKRFVKRT